MTRDEYNEWTLKLSYCPRTRRLMWPSRDLAEEAVPWMVESCELSGRSTPNPGVYECDYRGGCGAFHLSRDTDWQPPGEDDNRPAGARQNTPRGRDRFRDRRNRGRRR